jgi:hypothetical protein
MNKLAIFVEGYTEVVFADKLVREIAGEHNVLIEWRRIKGGSASRRSYAQLQAAKENTGQKYFVQIVDCGGDQLVKTRIVEEHENLTRAGYSKIIGVRDVRPDFTYADIPRLEVSLRTYIKTSLAPVEFILAVMEIEAWFLAEATHFPKIDPTITVPAIIATVGLDPENDDLQLRPTPTDDLKACYAIGGKMYEKHAALTTVNALEFARVYFELGKRFPHLQRLIANIEAFLS